MTGVDKDVPTQEDRAAMCICIK